MKTVLNSVRSTLKKLPALAALALCASAAAAIPPAEKVLPDDTLVVITTPDFARVRALNNASPQSRFWYDPAMKPFRDKFMSKLNAELIEPLERDLGLRLHTFTNLLQGQFTFAVTQNGWQGSGDPSPALILLVDAKDKGGLLKINLADARRKWVDAGKSLKTERIRDIEFSAVALSGKDLPPSLKKFFGSDDAEEEAAAPATKASLLIGQYESLLIVGTSLKAVEKVAIRLTGGAMPALADVAAFEANRLAMFRGAPLYGWANVKAFVDIFTSKASGTDSQEGDPFGLFNPGKLITALGFAGVRTAAFNMEGAADGVAMNIFVSVPESSRQGLLKLFPGPGKESGPPPFVPADTVKFQRVRVDGAKAWTTLEKVLQDVSPTLANILNSILDNADSVAREKDPNFDIRKSLFGNLGDDVIAYEKAPKGSTLAELSSPPSIYLLGSPRPDQFVVGLRNLLALMGAPTERDFLGRKIHSIQLPAMPTPGGAQQPPRTLNYTSSGGYIAISADVALLEEYLRSSDSQQKALRETAGLAEATARIGGSSTGWFGYENQAETTRALLEALRKGSSQSLLSPGIPLFNPQGVFKDWLDFSLLPPFERIAKYFHFIVYNGGATTEGINLKTFYPVPPQLRGN